MPVNKAAVPRAVGQSCSYPVPIPTSILQNRSPTISSCPRPNGQMQNWHRSDAQNYSQLKDICKIPIFITVHKKMRVTKKKRETV